MTTWRLSVLFHFVPRAPAGPGSRAASLTGQMASGILRVTTGEPMKLEEIDKQEESATLDSAGRETGRPGRTRVRRRMRRLAVLGLVAVALAAVVSFQSQAGAVLSERSDRGRSNERLAGSSSERPKDGAGETEHDYLRFVPGDLGEGELQTSIVTMVGDGGVRVDLIAVVHVADGSYYRKLQKRFTTYDSLLYEMVKDDDVKPVPGEGGDGLLTFFQRSLKDLLDLEFQLDAVDYTRRNFVHADLDPDTFYRLQKERGENIFSLMFKVLRADLLARQKGNPSAQVGLLQLALAFSSDDSARALKYLLAQQMENMEALLAGIEDTPSGEGSVIVAERNKKALEVLRRRLRAGEKKLGIFYGAAHMPDMEKRLVEDFKDLKLRRSGEKWLAAWSIRNKKQAKPVGPFERFLPGKKPESSDRSSTDGHPSGSRERAF